jgi:hypothetical protein
MVRGAAVAARWQAAWYAGAGDPLSAAGYAAARAEGAWQLEQARTAFLAAHPPVPVGEGG